MIIICPSQKKYIHSQRTRTHFFEKKTNCMFMISKNLMNKITKKFSNTFSMKTVKLNLKTAIRNLQNLSTKFCPRIINQIALSLLKILNWLSYVWEVQNISTTKKEGPRNLYFRYWLRLLRRNSMTNTSSLTWRSLFNYSMMSKTCLLAGRTTKKCN